MTPEMTLILMFWLICGIVGSLIGRPTGFPVWGFFAGVLLGIIGIAIVALCPPKKVATE